MGMFAPSRSRWVCLNNLRLLFEGSEALQNLSRCARLLPRDLIVRANLLRPEQSLRAYRWSSYGEYLKEARHRVKWLRVDRVLGEMGIMKPSARNSWRKRTRSWDLIITAASRADCGWKRLSRSNGSRLAW